MSCPAPEQLAAAATEDDAAVLAHVETCASCLHALDDQRALRALARRTPDVVLTRDRREAMAAELMARADALPAPGVLPAPLALSRDRREAMAAALMAQADRLPEPPSIVRPSAVRRRKVALLVAGLAAAAALVVVVARRDGTAIRPPLTAAPTPVATPPPEPASTAPGSGSAAPTLTVVPLADPDDAPPAPREVATPASREPRRAAPRAIAMLGGTGDFARDAGDASATRDLVRLRDGELTVDATSSRPVEVVRGGTAISIHKARVKVVASHGVVSSVAVFAGTAEVTVDGHRVIVEAGAVWERDVARDDALAAFRAGWTALRTGDNAAAIAAFDRATDPAVAEDASYWSAIASERAGDAEGAVRRYRELLARFPSTTRAAEARAAITRLAP